MPLALSAHAWPEATNVTVSDFFGSSGVHAGNASPDASVVAGCDGVGLALGPRLGSLDEEDGVATPAGVGVGGGVEAHAVSAKSTATNVAAADLHTGLSLGHCGDGRSRWIAHLGTVGHPCPGCVSAG